jgi:hypothetical protein
MITLDAFGNPVVGDPDQNGVVTVENTAALRTFKAAPNQGYMVITLGDVSEGDGNGGLWFWVDYSTATDDGVNVVKCTDILAGRFFRYAIDSGTAVVAGNSVLGNSTASPAPASAISATAAGLALLGAASAAAQRTALGLVIGTNVQAQDAELSAIAGLTSAADKVPYFTGSGTAALSSFTTAGRAMSAAADATAQRVLLGLTDLGDEAVNELVHANTVCAFTKPSVCKAFSNHAKVGTLGSEWTALVGGTGALGNSGKGVAISSWPGGGGANILTTGATASSYVQLISIVDGLSLMGGAMIDNLVSATGKWHMETVFKISTTPGANTQIGVGWVDSSGADQLLVGVRGAQSTTKFRVFKGGTSTGTNSAVSIDTSPHRFRMWGNGDGKVYFSVDYETPVELSGVTWADTVAAPFVAMANGATAAAQTIYLGTTRYRVNGAVA